MGFTEEHPSPVLKSVLKSGIFALETKMLHLRITEGFPPRVFGVCNPPTMGTNLKERGGFY